MQDHDQGKDVNKKRSTALKSSILQDSDSEEEEECSDHEENITMMARKFRNFFKIRNFKKDHKSCKKDDKKNEIICYKSNLGHMKYDCLESKEKGKFRRKAMKVTWDDSDDSS